MNRKAVIFNPQKAATFAFMAEMLSLVPFMFFCVYRYDSIKAVPMSFGLSFAVTIFAFTAALIVLERRERRGAAYD